MSERLTKILVVDDEELARQKIARYVREIDETAAIKEASNGLEAIAAVKDFDPDILFLDIQMPGLNGFEVLDHLVERRFAVIFQTAFDEFAIKAFEENACDYLLKPFARERFAKAFERARRDGTQRQAELGLLKAVTASRRFLEHLFVDDRGVRILIDVDAVDALVSRDHYTCIHAASKEYLLDQSLQRLEERLNPEAFIRVHRAAVVRVAAIRAMTKGDEPVIELHSGVSVSVSRRCRGAVIERLKTATGFKN